MIVVARRYCNTCVNVSYCKKHFEENCETYAPDHPITVYTKEEVKEMTKELVETLKRAKSDTERAYVKLLIYFPEHFDYIDKALESFKEKE